MFCGVETVHSHAILLYEKGFNFLVRNLVWNIYVDVMCMLSVGCSQLLTALSTYCEPNHTTNDSQKAIESTVSLCCLFVS